MNEGNYATIMHNNAFALHRLMVPGQTSFSDRLFDRITDQGRLGYLTIAGEEVPVGGNEDIAQAFYFLQKGIKVKAALLAGIHTIVRDPNLEISSVNKKVLRRPQVCEKYREHYNVTIDELNDYIRNYYEIIFE